MGLPYIISVVDSLLLENSFLLSLIDFQLWWVGVGEGGGGAGGVEGRGWFACYIGDIG